MAIEWQVTLVSTGEVIEEPLSVNPSTNYVFRFTNISSTGTAAEAGFYLKETTWTGELDFPSTEGSVVDWYDVLSWGSADPTEGAFITQGATTTQLTLEVGTASNPLALTIGTGTDSDQIGPGESVDITLSIVVPGSVSARRLFFDMGIDFQEV